MHQVPNPNRPLSKGILALVLSAALISVVKGDVTCTGANSTIDCCWVEQLWQVMSPSANKKADYSGKAAGCCSQRGVTCSSGKVIYVTWAGGISPLSGEIPSSIGNLTNLIYLYVSAGFLTSKVLLFPIT